MGAITTLWKNMLIPKQKLDKIDKDTINLDDIKLQLKKQCLMQSVSSSRRQWQQWT